MSVNHHMILSQSLILIFIRNINQIKIISKHHFKITQYNIKNRIVSLDGHLDLLIIHKLFNLSSKVVRS